MKDNVVVDKSYAFSIRVIKAHKHLNDNKKTILSNQFLRSGTAISALAHEAVHAQSRKDFINKMNIALKEANETRYWIKLFYENGYINDASFNSIIGDCNELICILASIVKTTKNNTPDAAK